MSDQTSTMAPKRRLAWAIYDERAGYGAIVTDLDTEQWAAGSGDTETAARALAVRRLAGVSERPRAGSGTLIDQCRAYVLRCQDVPARFVSGLLRVLDEGSEPAAVDSGPIEDVRGRVRQILRGPVCPDCGVQADDDVIEEVDAALRNGLLGGTDA